MIASFLESWSLFRYTYLAGFEIALLLPLLGVPVVVRREIFLGAAVTQASALGVAAALALGASTVSGVIGLLPMLALLAAVAAALLLTRLGVGGPEARSAWLFLLGLSASVLLLAHDPHGLEELHRLTTSSIIGATPGDVMLLGALLVLVVGLVARFVDPILLFATDPVFAHSVGVRTGAASVALAVALGLAVGLALRTAGFVYTFGMLVLPPLAAKQLCAELRHLFVVAPLLGVGAAGVGFVLAHGWDLPPGQLAVALLASLLGALWLLRAARVRS